MSCSNSVMNVIKRLISSSMETGSVVVMIADLSTITILILFLIFPHLINKKLSLLELEEVEDGDPMPQDGAMVQDGTRAQDGLKVQNGEESSLLVYGHQKEGTSRYSTGMRGLLNYVSSIPRYLINRWRGYGLRCSMEHMAPLKTLPEPM